MLHINRDKFTRIFESFLEDENLKVLAVNGQWGVGKTYLVRQLLSNNLNKEYYYTSMFGVSNIENLMAKLLSSNLQISKILEINSKRKINLGIFQIPFLNNNFKVPASIFSITGDLLLSILFRNIKGTLFCIDDLERNSCLEIDEVLGFIDSLVSEQDCKVIVIYNENEILTEERRDKFKKYKEKVFDLELNLFPEQEENISLIFSDRQKYEIVYEYSMRRSIQNVRTIKKMKKVYDILESEMAKTNIRVNDFIYEKLIYNSLLLTQMYYEPSLLQENNSIKEDNIEDISVNDFVDYFDNLNIPSERSRSKIDKIIFFHGKYRYEPCGIESIILNYIQTSIFEKDTFEKKLQEISSKQEYLEQKNQVWDLYYESFDDNRSEIRSGLSQLIQQNFDLISLKELRDMDNIATHVNLDLIDFYERKVNELTCSDDLEKLYYCLRLTHGMPTLESQLRMRINEVESHMTISGVLSDIVRDGHWNEYQMDILNSYSEEDIRQFIYHSHPNKMDMVRQGINIGGDFSVKLRSIIKESAGSNPLNEMRARYLYNIDLS